MSFIVSECKHVAQFLGTSKAEKASLQRSHQARRQLSNWRGESPSSAQKHRPQGNKNTHTIFVFC